MTPAVDLLNKLAMAYKLHEYEHDAKASSYGLEAAEKLAVEPQRVFKTLVVEADNETLAVAVLPVDRQLNLKLMAKAIGMKKVTMADPVAVSRSSGYVLVGGHRGLEIELSASDLAQATRAAFWVIT